MLRLPGTLYLGTKTAKMVLLDVLEALVLSALRMADPVEVAGKKVGLGMETLLVHHLSCHTPCQHREMSSKAVMIVTTFLFTVKMCRRTYQASRFHENSDDRIFQLHYSSSPPYAFVAPIPRLSSIVQPGVHRSRPCRSDQHDARVSCEQVERWQVWTASLREDAWYSLPILDLSTAHALLPDVGTIPRQPGQVQGPVSLVPLHGWTVLNRFFRSFMLQED